MGDTGKYCRSDSSNSFDSRPLPDLCRLGEKVVEEPDSFLRDLSSVPAYLEPGAVAVCRSDFAGYGRRMVRSCDRKKSCGWIAGNHQALCADRGVCGGYLCGTAAGLPDGLGNLRFLCFSADENYISENLRQLEVGERSVEGRDIPVSPAVPSG